MRGKYRGSPKNRRPRKIDTGKTAEEIAKELKKHVPSGKDYRERSLKIHGLLCAKCGREFKEKDRHLLTVHHKDGDPYNNPSDGSNWENLCVFCHDDEHSRNILADYLIDQKKK